METETGWLNVREGPGINFDVAMGKKFVELEQKENKAGEEWVKIQVDKETKGWVFGKYVKEEEK